MVVECNFVFLKHWTLSKTLIREDHHVTETSLDSLRPATALSKYLSSYLAKR